MKIPVRFVCFALCLILPLFVQSSPAHAAGKLTVPPIAIDAEKLPPGIDTFNPPIPVPEFHFADETGTDVNLAAFRGRFVLLNIWATWCGPCVHEMPHLQKLMHMLEGQNINIVTVSVDRSVALVSKFMQDNNYSLPPYIDAASTSTRILSISGLPTTFLIDPAGNIILRGVGGIGWSEAPYLPLITKALEVPDQKTATDSDRKI